MSTESLFIFKLEGEGDDSPRPEPGRASRIPRGDTPGPQPTPAPSSDPRGPARPGQPGQDFGFAQDVADAIQRASRYSTTASFARAGADLLRPLTDLGRALASFRAGGDGEGRGNRQSQTGAFPGRNEQDSRISPSFTIREGIFHAEGARIVIMNPTIQPQQAPQSPVQPRAPRSSPTTPPPRSPRGGPGTGLSGPLDRGGLPAVPSGGLPSAPGTGLGRVLEGELLPALNGTRVSLTGITTNAIAARSSLAAVAGTATAVTIPLGALVIAAGAAAVALRALYNRANEQATRLAQYSAELAAAQARSEIASTRQDIRSAQYLGRDLARLVAIQSRAGVATDRILDVFEKALLQRLLPILETIVKLLEMLDPDKTVSATGVVFEGALTAALVPMLGPLAPLATAAINYFRSEEKKEVVASADYMRLFEQLADLDVDGVEGRQGLPKNGKRFGVNAAEWGDLPLN